jgi:hypothetical protein
MPAWNGGELLPAGLELCRSSARLSGLRSQTLPAEAVYELNRRSSLSALVFGLLILFEPHFDLPVSNSDLHLGNGMNGRSVDDAAVLDREG